MKKIRNIIFICLGNTARSPTAEFLAKFYAKKYDIKLNIESAGFMNAFSYMQPGSQKYLNAKGIDHSDFKPKILSKPLLEKQDLILTMERSQSIEIIRNFSSISNINEKVMTLKEFNGDFSNRDIMDPYYTNSDTYLKILKIIDINIENLIQKIKERNN
ncbi:MAG: hypothetical protein ACFFBY_15800 [Promethearchaeota archaeon]